MITFPRRPPAWDIAIAGGGVASLALGLALRQGAGDAVRVTIFDPAGDGRIDRRAYAVSPGSRAMLETLGVWHHVGSEGQTIRGMRITDSRETDAIRPEYLRFGNAHGEPLGFMLEGERIATALRGACREAGVIFGDGAVTFVETTPVALLVDAGGERRRVSLLVAADGARSRLREEAGIGWVGRRYPQRALVATVAHERDHGGVAIQHFLPAGPFAILPLAGSGGAYPFRSSIVWTEDERRAATLLDDPERADEDLASRFGTELGAIRRATPLGSFPLGVGLARRFVAPRLALLGDAAHEIHPLAGQGLNLGLSDAASLAEEIVDAVRLGLDPGSPAVLEAYERSRRFDAVLLAGVTDGLNRLFSNDALGTRLLRDLGLGLVDRSLLSRLFVTEASGRTNRAPRLMRGEAL